MTVTLPIEPPAKCINGVISKVDNDHLDERDRALLADARAAWQARADASPGVPLEGEWLRGPDGKTARVAAVWDWPGEPPEKAVVQPADLRFGGGSVHLAGSGYGSYSGSLSGCVAVPHLTLLPEPALARFWIWHHAWRKADNGVDVWIPVRVWQVNP